MSSNSFLFKQQPSNLARFGLWTGFFFSVNVVIGAGFLALPFSFANSGWFPSLIFMIVSAIISYYLGRVTLELFCRAEAIKTIQESGVFIKNPSIREIVLGGYIEKDFSKEAPEEVEFEITDRRFDMSKLVEIFMGNIYGKVYLFFLYLFLSGAQTAYVSVFASSFSSKIPLGFNGTCNIYEHPDLSDSCRINYWIFLSIYAVPMFYFTIKGLREQQWLQVTMSILRFVIIGIMIITSLALIGQEATINSGEHNPFKMPQVANSKGLLGAIPTIFFALLFQLQFPSIAEFIREKKRDLKKIIFMVTIATATVYALIAMIIPIAVHDVKPQCSLDFSDYSAGYSQSEKPVWTSIISYTVVLFPAFDVFSSFPLMATAVADNLMSMKYGVSNEDFLSEKIKKNFRFFAVAIPIFISFFVFDLGKIIDFVGLLGLILLPITIPILHVASRTMLSTPTNYDTPFYFKVRTI